MILISGTKEKGGTIQPRRYWNYYKGQITVDKRISKQIFIYGVCNSKIKNIGLDYQAILKTRINLRKLMTNDQHKIIYVWGSVVNNTYFFLGDP